jgi:hypothetical protein
MADRLLAEFPTEAELAAAIRALRDLGHRRLEAYLPFPSHEVEEALARPRSRLPFAVFVAGLGGAGGAYALQWLVDAYLYPLVVGGRSPHFPLAFVIITFEMGVLFEALCAVIGTLVLGRLVRLTDEVQGTPGFDSATRDRFWLEVSAHDPAFDPELTAQALARAGASRIERAEDRR